MTSEGQQAGQPVDATSGDGFPPDTDGHRASDDHHAPDDFPSSYGPPPQATPNGGSPFVVPAVPPFGQGAPADRYGLPPAPPPSGSARVPQGSARVPQPADDGHPLPRRGSATDLFRDPTGPGPGGPGSPLDTSPAPAWAPQQSAASASADDDNPFTRPRRGGSDQQTDFDGFAPGSPTRGRLDQGPSGQGSQGPAWGPGFGPQSEADGDGPPGSRLPGISAFGDQRVRVPGATLTGLPDAPEPPVDAGSRFDPPPPRLGGTAPRFETPFPPRNTNGAAEIIDRTGTGESGTLPRRVASDDPTGFGPPARPGDGALPPRPADGEAGRVRRTTDLPIRGGRTPATGSPSFGNGFAIPESRATAENAGTSPFAAPSSPSSPFGAPSSPFAAPASQGAPAAGAPSPFGSTSPAPGSPYGSPAADTAPASFGGASAGSGAPYGSPALSGSDGPFGGPATGSDDSPFGASLGGRAYAGAGAESEPTGRPAFGDSPFGDSPFGGDSSRGDRSDPADRPGPGDQPGRSDQPAYGDRVPFGDRVPYVDPLSDPPRRADQPGAADQPGVPSQFSGTPSTYGEATGYGDSAAGQPPYGEPAGQSPYGEPAGQSPYGEPGSQSPYGEPAGQSPYGEPASQSSYGEPGSARSPYGAPVGNQSPYGAPAGNQPPYGEPVGSRPRFDEPSGQHPYGDAGSQPPYGDVAGQPPYGGPSGQHPYGDAGNQSPYGDSGSQSPYGTPAGQQPFPPFGDNGDPNGLPPYDDPSSRPAFGGLADGTKQPYGSTSPFRDQSAARHESPEQPAGPGGFDDSEPPAYGESGPRAVSYGTPQVPDAPPQEERRPFGTPGHYGKPVQKTEDESPYARQPYAAGSDDAPSGESPYGPGSQFGRPRSDEDEAERSGGYAQRVPGASFGPSGSPVVVDSHAAVPAPRDPSDGGAVKGTARPVSASASVPMGNRVGPAESEDVPPPAQAPKARVYGRPAQPVEEDDPVPVSPFGRPGEGRFGDDPIGGVSQDLPPLGPKTPPPGGMPTSARATASARVAPPAPPGPDGQPFGDLTTGVSGRGRNTPPDNYGENTSDMAGRGQDQPYVPAPALPSLHARSPLVDGFPPAPGSADAIPQQSGFSPERPRLGGVFPGPGGPGPGSPNPGPGSPGPGGFSPNNGLGPNDSFGFPSGPGTQSRATVTPPGPDETSSWAGPEGEGDQSRFDQFKPEPETAVKPEPAPTRVRMLPIVVGVVLVGALIIGLAMGVVWLLGRSSDSGFSASAGDCVKRSGTEAVKATCGDAGSFTVVSVVDSKDKCPDANQPYVLNGKSQVLCLKPTS
jgi:collagen type III alpha